MCIIHFSAKNSASRLQQLLKSVVIITIMWCISMIAICGTTFLCCKLSLQPHYTDLLTYGKLLLMAVPGISVWEVQFQYDAPIIPEGFLLGTLPDLK